MTPLLCFAPRLRASFLCFAQKAYTCEAIGIFTRKGYATSVSGKTANGCPVRSAKPPDKIDQYFISPCGRNSARLSFEHGNLPQIYFVSAEILFSFFLPRLLTKGVRNDSIKVSAKANCPRLAAWHFASYGFCQYRSGWMARMFLPQRRSCDYWTVCRAGFARRCELAARLSPLPPLLFAGGFLCRSSKNAS